MRVEAVVFPTTWKRIGSKLEKGGLVVIQATVQQQDDDFKLIVEDCIPIERDESNLAEQVIRLQKQAQARAARSSGGSSATSAAAAKEPVQGSGNLGKGNHSGEKRPERIAAAESKPQRAYIKIIAENEEPAVLEKLKRLLAGHSGQNDTVLFYMRGKKSIALSSSYRVKPSPQLIAAIEELLGEGTIVIK